MNCNSFLSQVIKNITIISSNMHGKLIPILLLSLFVVVFFFDDNKIAMTCRCIYCSGGSRPSGKAG